MVKYCVFLNRNSVCSIEIMEDQIKTYKICTACNFFCSSNEIDEYCSLCGTKLIDTCRSCGCEISNPYARFCKKCSKPLRDDTEKKSKIIHKRI